MALDKFNWQNGSQVEPAKVEVEGVSYDVVDAQYEGETPLSASNLNLMQDTLLGNVVDDLEDESKIASCKAVKDVYSSDEIKTNKVWIDNKPIYRKTFTIGSVSSGSTATLGTINNLDTPTLMVGTSYYNGLWTTIPRTHSSNNIYQNQVYIDSGGVKVACGSSSAITKGYLVLEYTKTTD